MTPQFLREIFQLSSVQDVNDFQDELEQFFHQETQDPSTLMAFSNAQEGIDSIDELFVWCTRI